MADDASTRGSSRGISRDAAVPEARRGGPRPCAMAVGRLARRVAAQAPRPGGILKQAWPSSPRTLDPALAIQGDEYMIMQNIFDNLVRIDEKLQPQPQLATRWTADDQGKTWTFTLRPGVKFHHGKPLTAQDVVFTVERILDPKTASPGRSALGTDREGGGRRRRDGSVPPVGALRRPADGAGRDLRPHLALRSGGQDRVRAVGHGPVPARRVPARRPYAHGEERGLLGRREAVPRRAVAGERPSGCHPDRVTGGRRRADGLRGADLLHRVAPAEHRRSRSSRSRARRSSR